MIRWKNDCECVVEVECSIVKMRIGHAIMHSNGLGVRVKDREMEQVARIWHDWGVNFDYYKHF